MLIKHCQQCKKIFKTYHKKGKFCSHSCAMKFRNTKHGMRFTNFYYVYGNLYSRCKYPTNKRYKNYGGRGIKCLWKSFEEFRDDMYKSYLEHIKKFGEQQTQIDRINNNGNYYRENCRWVTVLEQARNKRNNVFITFRGKTKCLTDWAKKISIDRRTISKRIKSNWSTKKTLTTPINR